MRRIIADGDLLGIRRLREGMRDGYLSDFGDVGLEPVASGSRLAWDDVPLPPAPQVSPPGPSSIVAALPPEK